MDLRIVLLPDQKGLDLYERYSKNLYQNFDCFFKLGPSAIPHITLIHAKEVSKDEFLKLQNSIEAISEKYNEVELSFESPRPGTQEGFLGISFKDFSIPGKIRRDIFESSNKSLKNVSEFEEPHVTLTRFKDNEDVSRSIPLVSEFPKENLIFNRIAICQNGENGTCVKILYSTFLGK